MYQTIDKPVNVLAYYFGRGSAVRCFPKRVEVEGRQVDFDSGLRCLVGKGKGLMQVFMMSDGQYQYRLSFTPEEEQWRLLSIRGERQ